MVTLSCERNVSHQFGDHLDFPNCPHHMDCDSLSYHHYGFQVPTSISEVDHNYHSLWKKNKESNICKSNVTKIWLWSTVILQLLTFLNKRSIFAEHVWGQFFCHMYCQPSLFCSFAVIIFTYDVLFLSRFFMMARLSKQYEAVRFCFLLSKNHMVKMLPKCFNIENSLPRWCYGNNSSACVVCLV